MVKGIEAYVEQIVSKLACSRKDREEIRVEMTDHLLMLKKDYIEKGYSEEKAIEIAIQLFGEEKEIRKGYEKSMFPFKNAGKILAIIFGSCILLVMFNQPFTSGNFFGFLFLFLLISSFVVFGLAWYVKSWVLMIISGILLFPVTWFMSGYPPFPWAIYIPVIHLVLAIIIYQANKIKCKLSKN